MILGVQFLRTRKWLYLYSNKETAAAPGMVQQNWCSAKQGVFLIKWCIPADQAGKSSQKTIFCCFPVQGANLQAGRKRAGFQLNLHCNCRLKNGIPPQPPNNTTCYLDHITETFPQLGHEHATYSKVRTAHAPVRSFREGNKSFLFFFNCFYTDEARISIKIQFNIHNNCLTFAEWIKKHDISPRLSHLMNRSKNRCEVFFYL